MYPKGIVKVDKDASSGDTRLTVSILDGITCAGCGGLRWISGKGICSDTCEGSFDPEPETSGRWSSRTCEIGLGTGKGEAGCKLAGLGARVSLEDSSK